MRRLAPRLLKGAVRPLENDSAFLLDVHRRGTPQRETMRGWFSLLGTSSPTTRPRRITTARSATSMT